jgi:hypothetical protein
VPKKSVTTRHVLDINGLACPCYSLHRFHDVTQVIRRRYACVWGSHRLVWGSHRSSSSSDQDICILMDGIRARSSHSCSTRNIAQRHIPTSLLVHFPFPAATFPGHALPKRADSSLLSHPLPCLPWSTVPSCRTSSWPNRGPRLAGSTSHSLANPG